MGFTATTKYIIDSLDSTIAVTSIGYVGGNSIGFDGGVRVLPTTEIDIYSDGDYGIGFGIEVGPSGDLGNAEVYLDVVPATIVGLNSSWLNIVTPISLTGCDYLTSISSVIQVDQIIKPPILFSQAQSMP